MPVTEKDRDILARTLWGEARGEGLGGQIAVAWTIRNRVNDGKDKSWWGEGFAGVCQKPYQFSCWNKTDPNYQFLIGVKQISFRELAQARIAADHVIDGKVPDPTGGATHYYAIAMKTPPAWASKAKQTLKLGGARVLQGCAMSPVVWKVAGALALVLLGAIGAWQVQDWRYGAQLAEQSRLHTDTLNQLAMVGAAAQKAEQDKRLALEQRLTASDQSHHETLTNAQKDQARLRDRLATSDLRLSVVLAQGSARGCPVPATAGAGGVVHGVVRAELDPAHAQRIIAIIGEGDRGLIALAACQAYVRELSRR